MTIRHSAEVAADCLVSAGDNRQVPVILSNVSACRQCARGNGCGAGLLTLGKHRVELQCSTRQSLSRGQRVTIEIDDDGSSWLIVVLLAFGLPVTGLGVGMVLGSTLGTFPGPADWPAATGAFFGLTGGVLAWQRVAPHLDNQALVGLCNQSARIVNIESDS